MTKMYYKIYYKSVLSITFTLILLSAITPPVNSCWGSTSTKLGDMTKDQKLLNGSQLLIDCSLNNNTIEYENEIYQVDSSMILFKFQNQIYPKDRIQLINETVARLLVEKSSETDNGLYYCLLNITGLDHRPFVCLSQVIVGYKPQSVTNFKCISLHYRKLHCSWTLPKNPIPTSYHLEDKVHASIEHFTRNCGNIPSENSCEWTVDTTPPYRNTALQFNLLLTGTNQFGNNSELFVVDHYSIIKPNIPKNLKALEVTTNMIGLNWSPPDYIEFDEELLENIIYELRYFSLNPNQKDKSQTVILDGIHRLSTNITDLNPYLNYNISIRCKTIQSKRAEYWSEFSSIIVMTKADVPYLAPEMISESFQTDKNMEDFRSITLFWKEIAPNFRNGPDFYYLIQYKQLEKRKIRDINQLEKRGNKGIKCLNTTYTFNHMVSDVAYEFTIYGVNNIGISSNGSRIVIEKNDIIPHKPSNIDVYSFGGGRYEIHWTKPLQTSSSGQIVNYTVFWCQTLRPRPFPCEGTINWLPSKNTSITLELPDVGTNYQFAVSANALTASSGMSWAECIVPIDGRLDKLSEVRLKAHNSTSIVVNWKLNCPAQKRVVEGYKIKFCRTKERTGTVCEEDPKFFEVDNSVESYALNNLEPYSKYRITVLANSDTGPSEESDPRYETTPHDSPEDAPSGLEVIEKRENMIELVWMLPIKPNGLLNHFYIECNDKVYTQSADKCNETHCYYTIENLESYHSYKIRVRACNAEALCSPESKLLTVLTSKSVPIMMEPPRSEVINTTTVRISWSPPVVANGPIDIYSIKLIRTDNSTQILNISGKMKDYYLTIDCESISDISPSYQSQYSVQISSGNVLENGVIALADFSESTNLNACLLKHERNIGYIIGLIAGGAVGLLALVLVLVFLIRRMKKWINYNRNFDIELPKGLEVPDFSCLVTNSEPTDDQPYDPFGRSDSYTNIGIAVNVDNDSIIDKNRHGSGLSHTSNSSTEILYKKTITKTKDNFLRMISDDSGQLESGSSSTEAHMSSDSGVENDNQHQNKEPKDMQSINKVSPKPFFDENSDSSGSKDSGLDTNSGGLRPKNINRKRKLKNTKNSKMPSIIKPTPDMTVINPLYDTPLNHSVCIYSLLANSEPSIFEIPVREDVNISSNLTKFSKPEMAKSLTNIIQSYSPSDPKVNCIICETNNNSSRCSTRTASPNCPYYKYGIKRQNHNQNNFVANFAINKSRGEKVSKTNEGYITIDSIPQSVALKSSKKRLEHDWSQNSYDAEVSSTSSNGDNEQTDLMLTQNNNFTKSLSFTDCEKIQNKIQNNSSFDDNTELNVMNSIDSSVNPLNTSSYDIVIEFEPQFIAIKDSNEKTTQVKPSPTHLAKDMKGYVLHNAFNPMSVNQINPNLIKNSNGYVVIDAVNNGYEGNGIEMTDYVPNTKIVNHVTQV